MPTRTIKDTIREKKLKIEVLRSQAEAAAAVWVPAL